MRTSEAIAGAGAVMANAIERISGQDIDGDSPIGNVIGVLVPALAIAGREYSRELASYLCVGPPHQSGGERCENDLGMM